MSTYKLLILTACCALLAACSGGEPTTAPAATEPPPARVYIVSPADGATLTSPVTVVFGIENFGIAPAGTYDAATGHHHLLIDTQLPALDQPIPADGQHVHFGKGQTETSLELGPGSHTLQLLLGDGNHVPHDAALISEPVTIVIKESITDSITDAPDAVE
jgi:hypothetical protein